MNPRPDQNGFAGFGALPAAPSGLRHLAPWVKVIAGGGAVAAITFYALQVGLPDRFRPSSVAGDAAGDTVRHEIEASREARIDMERRIADATAQAQAKAQADVIAIQAAVQERTANLAGLQGIASLSDVTCAAAQVVSSLTQPQGFSRSSTDDYYRFAQRLGASTCGVSEGIRQEILASQLESIRTAAVERGAPLNDGAVRTVSTSTAPADSPLPVSAVAHRHLTQSDRDQLKAYANRQSDAVRIQFIEGIDTARFGLTDLWYDRVAAYQEAHLN